MTTPGSGRDRAIEAAARALATAAETQWSEMDKDDRADAKFCADAALAAALPVLLNDLADSVQDAIEDARDHHNVVPGLGYAVELETVKKIARDAVRAAAAGWGTE